MSLNINQLHTVNPTTTFNSDDLMYLGRSPYGATDDFAFEYSDLIPLTTKGDLFTFSTTNARLSVGSDNQLLQAKSSEATGLSWTTATYPETTTANELLYSSATNAIGGLSTANNGTLVTDASGVPSISSTLPSAVQDNITRLGTITSVGAPLGVGFGGTGTFGTFTQGSVVFAGASGVYTQDNAQFFWNDTSNRLGLGTSTPGAKLDVVAGLETEIGCVISGPAAPTAPRLRVNGVPNGAQESVLIASNSTSATGGRGLRISATDLAVAAFFDYSGNGGVSGSFTKGSGTFKIDHPLDPLNKFLYHSFIESPDMMNIYNGEIVLDVNGEGTVILPSYFEALNKDFRYQLTPIGSYAPIYISSEISNNEFSIAGGTSGLKVSWQVTGIRKDKFAEANRVIPEVDKEGDEIGTYLHPHLFS